MYSFSTSRTIALLIAIASVFPFISPIQLGSSGSSLFDTVPPAGWGVFLCATILIVWWAILVYRIVVAYLSLTYEGDGHIPKGTQATYGVVLTRLTRFLSAFRVRASETRRVRWQTTLTSAILVSAIIGIVGAVSIDSVVEIATQKRFVAPQTLDDWKAIIATAVFLVIFSPFVETLIMGATLEPFRKRWMGWPVLPFVSGVVWGLVHAVANHPYQLFSMIWLFFVLSTLYVRTRSQYSFWKTFGVVCMAHAVNNFLALFLVVLRQNLL